MMWRRIARAFGSDSLKNMKSIFKKIVVSILTFEAKAALKRHNPRIIAVTGSVGKTSTKDAIFAAVSGSFKTRKSQKSMNSEIGLPLAILGLENAWSSPAGWVKNIIAGWRVAHYDQKGKKAFPQMLVLEVGADHPGDIESISKWLHPDIVVLTRMSDVPVHVEFFKDAADVLREKMYLAHALKSNGTLVVNADDEQFQRATRDIEAKKVFYGTSKLASVEIVASDILYDNDPLALPVGQYSVMRIGDTEMRLELMGVIGSHVMYPFAAATTVAQILGIESVVPKAFHNFESPRGRMRIIRGINSSAIIDDTYNSSPLACTEALKTMEKVLLRGRKIAALADMKELGKNTEEAHKNIGKLAAQTLHTLVTVGDFGKLIAQGAIEAGMTSDRIFSFATSIEAGKALYDMIRAGDIVLVKGSQSMRMERVSKALLAEPDKASELLVRQEEEWGRR